jgi:hypothetical protein
MRHLGIVASSAPQASAPSITINSVTNFNQDRATLNATVNPNGATTSVKFQISTNNSTWTDVTTITGLTGDSQSIYYNHTGLSNGTLYYIRAIATNSAGESTSSSTSFTTWSLQVYERSTSGGTTFTIPTVTPTGGSAVAVSIYDIIMFGGGGGASSYNGGGGGGYQNVESRSVNGNRSVTTSVGAGGTGGTNTIDDTGETQSTSGGNTTLTGDLTTLTANGGALSGITPNGGGTSGNGNAAGSSATDNNGGKDLGRSGYGGGGGAGAVGGNGSADDNNGYGGTGGAGVSITLGGVTLTGGAGGGGGGWNSLGAGVNGARGSNNTYGSGGNALGGFGTGGSGQAGYIRFRYYAASALA